MTSEPDTFRFDAETHTYHLGSLSLPSVTQIMAAGGLVSYDWVNSWVMERGSNVHLACQFLDEGRLDASSVDPRIEGYLRAWKAATRQLEIEILSIEESMYDPQLQFAGTLDRTALVSLNGKRVKAIIDIKTGAATRTHAVQLAAYWYLKKLSSPGPWKRITVHLDAFGGYVVKLYSSPEHDFNVFLAALTVARWKGVLHE